jgi:glutaredoxin-related protein
MEASSMKVATEDQAIVVLLLMASLMAYITPNETTKKFDKLRTQTRKGIKALHKKDESVFFQLAIKADEIWVEVQKEIDNKDYEISIALSINTLYGFLDGHKLQSLFYSQKTFKSAISSALHSYKDKQGYEDRIHTDSVKLTEIFARVLGIIEPTKLSFIKLKIKNSEILHLKAA